MSGRVDGTIRGGRFGGVLPALGLLLLAPACAEYLVGYDSSTGQPLALLAGLVIFVPLYGAPALLIRELAQRLRVRWPGVVAMAAAAGVLQAGVIDQSLFSESYRGIESWAATIAPTWIAPLGLSGDSAINFVGGHVIWSFCAPIAVVSALRPKLSTKPWLGLPGLIVTAAAYVAAAWLVLSQHLRTESDHASPAQVIASALVAAALIGFAVTFGRKRAAVTARAVPAPWLVGVSSLVVGVAVNFAAPSIPGFAVKVAALAFGAAGIWWFGRSSRWNGRHIVAVATGMLVARAVTGFFAVPLGDVAPAAKFIHNAGFLLAVVLLGAWAAARNRSGKSYVSG